MRLSKVMVFAVTLGVVGVDAVESPNGLLNSSSISNANGNNCGQQATVYVTVTAPASTLEVAVKSALIDSAASVDMPAFSNTLNLQPIIPASSTDTTTDITSTRTIFITYTESIQVAAATPTSSVAGDGEPYHFSELAGPTTSQSGEAPSGTQGSVTSTSTIQAAPVSPEANQHSTSDGTIFLTLTSTVHLTRTIVEVHNTTATSARSFTGIGAGGWNATGTTLQTVKGGPTGSGVSALSDQSHQTGVVSAIPNALPSGYAYGVPSPTGQLYRKKGKRQVGSIVVATINGVVVSWTNFFDGVAPATPIPSPPAKAEPPLVPASYGSKPTFLVASPPSASSQTLKAPQQIPSPPAKAEPPLVPVSSSAGYGYQPSLPVAVSSSTSSQTSDPSKPTITQTAAPTTVTQGVQPATSTTSASPTVVGSSSAALSSAALSSAALSSSTAPSAPTSTACGEIGKFTLDFDDLPTFSTTNNDTADYPPIFNPYRHLFFSGGYAYAPPPTDPFQPTSPPHLAVFTANMTGQPLFPTTSPDVGTDILGEFGAGPRARDSAYWIDAHGASMGCDNRGPEDCIVTFSGFAYLKATDEEVLRVAATARIPPCPELRDCPLHPVLLSDNFTGLSGLRIVARVGDKPVIWFMDDVQLAWSVNTCAAGLERSRHR